MRSLMRREGWHTIAQVAELLGVSKDAVYSAIRDGSLRAVMPRLRSRGMLVSDEELDRFFAEEFVPGTTSRSATGSTR